MKWECVVPGQPVSKANRRKIVRNGRTGKPMVIKSPEARAYEACVKAHAGLNAPPRLLLGRLKLSGTLYYKSRRSDLDPSVLLDSLQEIVYKNDRQVREINIVFDVDKENPRADITVVELEPPAEG